MMLSVGEGDEKPLKDPLMFRRAPRGAAGGIRAAVLRVMACFAAFVGLLFFAIPAQADEVEPAPQAEPEPVPDVVPEEEEEFSEPAWIPSFEIAFDAGDYDTTSSVDSSLGQSGGNSDSSDNLMFRLGGELMSPMLGQLPGNPRLFGRAGARLATRPNLETLEIGEIGAPEDAIPKFVEDRAAAIGRGCQNTDPPSCPKIEDIDGQGSDIRATFSQPSWYAGAGIAFTIPLPSYGALRIKPSVEYKGEHIEMRGRVTSVTEPQFDEFLVHRSLETKSITDHFVGPGLELEFILGRSAGPIAFSIYADSRFLWLVSDRTLSFAGPTTDPDGNPTGTATYTVKRDSLNIRFGAGVRFSWTGLGR